MTKKDYIAIAAIFDHALRDLATGGEKSSAEGDCGGYDEWQRLRNDLADLFAADNPRFDRERFYDACEK